jgi:hypothetical protein
MIYSVVPRPLADELYPKLMAHYSGNENVTVIVDRRRADRRMGSRPPALETVPGSTEADARQQRVVRDRRRARVPGDLPALARP